MKKRFLFCALFLLPGLGLAQGIRKNYTEMTTSEQNAYMAALDNLYSDDASQDVVQSLANDYWNYYDALYNHTCDHNEFFPFHRMMLWEMENALQKQNPKLTIPYWDWTTNNSPDDPLFTEFLNLDRLPPGWTGHLSRDLGANASLPVGGDVSVVQGANEYCNDADYENSYVDRLQSELGYSPQNWIGGSMMDYDLRDPLFYLHHAMLDKLWQNWYGIHNLSDLNSFVLDRYNGYTDGVNFSPLPYTESSYIQDGRSMGIFYSNNGEANLDGGYAVTNNYTSPENFVFPGRIVASNFTVPSGKNAVFVSQAGVTLSAGFVVDGGHLEIDVGNGYYDDNYSLSKSGAKGEKPINQKTPPRISAQDKFTIARSSQGFTARVWLQNASEVEGRVMSIDGKVASNLTQGGRLESGYHEFQLNVPNAAGALYYAYFKIGNQTYKQLLPKF